MSESIYQKKVLNEILQNFEYQKYIQDFHNKVSFSGQNQNEIILAVFRSAYIRNLFWLIEILILSISPILLPDLINIINSFGLIFIEKTFVSYTVIFVSYYSILLTFFIYKFLDWYLDIYVITSQRFIEIQFKPYGDIFMKEIWLSDIDVIKTRSAGLLGLILNYGNIQMITRTDSGGAELKYIANFNQIKNLISDLSKVNKKNKTYDI